MRIEEIEEIIKEEEKYNDMLNELKKFKDNLDKNKIQYLRNKYPKQDCVKFHKKLRLKDFEITSGRLFAVFNIYKQDGEVGGNIVKKSPTSYLTFDFLEE